MNPPATSSIDPGATQTGYVIGSQLNPGDLLAGRFRIEALIGIGGMGVVYRAHDRSLDIDVALKLLRPELARRPESFESFRRELLLARQVSSPHVVRIHDISEDAGRWFISMDYIPGESLEHKLDRSRALPIAQAVAITHGLLDGLGAAHQRGVVHRDLKPANVLINEEGHAYISDFGIARSLGATGLTQTGMIVGTPEYLSPEQARGLDVDGRSDLYAVGLMFYEMLVGELPFAGGTPAETVIQRILRPPPSLAEARPDLPRWMHAFSDRMLKVNPAHRFESAKAAIRALESRRVPRAPLNRRRIVWAVLTVLAVGAGSAWLWRHPGSVSHLLAPIPTPTPRVALLPIVAAEGDAELAVLARGLDAHLRAWLRGDAELSAVPRRRVLDAISRVAPNAPAESLARQLPEVARAAGATRLLQGTLAKDAQGQLELTLAEPAAASDKAVLHVRAADPAALYAAYVGQAGAWLTAEGWRVGRAPAMAAADLAPLGVALRELDDNHAAAAAAGIAASHPQPGASALLDKVRLDAEEADVQPLRAQATRRAIIATLPDGTDPLSLELRARALDGEGDTARAQALLGTARLAFPHDAGLALLDVETLAANGDGDRALELLRELVKNDDQDERAWFLLGRTAIQQGQPRRAVDDYLVRALVLNMRSENKPAEAETRNAMGIGYDRLGQADAAIEQYTRAVAIREKLDDQRGLAKTLRNLAVVQSVSGQRGAAEKSLDRARSILEKNGDRASLADLANDRGVIAEEDGDFSAALAAYREALAIRQQIDSPNLVAESLDNVGFSSFQLGKFDDARVYWEQALAMYQKLDDRNKMLRVEQSMSLLDTARGHFQSAHERLGKVLRTAQDSQLSEQEAAALVSLADLARIEGRYAQAGESAERAGQIFQRRSDQRGQTEAALLQAQVQLALGDGPGVDKALANIPLDKLGAEQRAEYRLVVAQRAAQAGNMTIAASHLDEAAKAAAQAHSGAIDMRIRLEKVRQALASSRSEEADTLLRQIGTQTGQLNQVSLRLQWLELGIANALRRHQRTAALGDYRDAISLLRESGDYAFASTVHALGARALEKGAEADAARAAAVAARVQLLDTAPATSRATLATELDRRLRSEAPADGE